MKNSSANTNSRVDVTFAIACYNAENFLEEAVRSALNQEGISVEVIIVDDGSKDESVSIAERLVSEDQRVKLLSTPQNSGPGGARNFALASMKGDWYAVLDSDDVLALNRSKTLIEAADKHNADVIADDLEIFGEGMETKQLFGEGGLSGSAELDLNTYFENSKIFGLNPSYGFLKPMIRRKVIEAEILRYNPRLRIGEDDELVIRLLAKGYRYVLVTHAMYKYRKHGSSISHRLSVENARKMLETESDVQTWIGEEKTSSKAYRQRFDSIKRAVAFVESVDKIKSKQYLGAIRTLMKHPAALLLYKMPIGAAWKRLIVRRSN